MRNPFRWFAETFPLVGGGQNDFSGGLPPRPAPPPPMRRSLEGHLLPFIAHGTVVLQHLDRDQPGWMK